MEEEVRLWGDQQHVDENTPYSPPPLPEFTGVDKEGRPSDTILGSFTAESPPIDIFKFFFHDALIDLIAFNSRQYAIMCGAGGLVDGFHPHYRFLDILAGQLMFYRGSTKKGVIVRGGGGRGGGGGGARDSPTKKMYRLENKKWQDETCQSYEVRDPSLASCREGGEGHRLRLEGIGAGDSCYCCNKHRVNKQRTRSKLVYCEDCGVVLCLPCWNGFHTLKRI